MLLTTFNEKAYKKMLQEESREEGREEGREEIKTLYRKLVADGRQTDLERALNDSSYEMQLLDEYHLK